MVNTYKKNFFVGNFFVSSYMQTPLRVSKSRSLYVMLISFVNLKLFFIKKKESGFDWSQGSQDYPIIIYCFRLWTSLKTN